MIFLQFKLIFDLQFRLWKCLRPFLEDDDNCWDLNMVNFQGVENNGKIERNMKIGKI